MGLFIKDKVNMLMKGYPTVSDKYDVAGAMLAGTAPVHFGELVVFNGDGFYKAVSSAISNVSEIAGFVVATNVKLAKGFANNEPVETLPGEAFNLLVKGFMAIQLAEGAVKADIVPNSAVKVVLANGGLTTSSVTEGTASLPNVVFTGTYEERDGMLLAEIYVK